MQKIILLFGFLLFSILLSAQVKNDTLRKAVLTSITDKFPSARIVDIQYQQYLPSDFDSELFGKNFEKGEITNHYRVKIAANIPVYKKPRYMVTTSFNYAFEGFELSNVTDATGNPATNYNYNPEFHYLSATVSFTYYGKLFKKPFIYNASIITDGSDKYIERVKGLLATSLVLKRTERTTMTVGAVLNIDPTAVVPIFPLFTVEHKFKNNPWTLDFILPQRLLFKRSMLENGRFSIGSELVSDGFYLYASQTAYEFRQLELRSGITYEYKMSKAFFSTFKAGLSNVFNSRITKRGESTNDYIWDSKQDGTAYFTVGISYNPFSKPKK